MIDLIHRFARILNNFLALFGLRLTRGQAGKTWHHAKAQDIIHSEVIPQATYSPWLSDQAFIHCYTQIKSNTLVDIYRCYELWQLSMQLSAVEGHYLEVGVWRGGTGCLLAKAVERTTKTVFLADTFSGVVKAGSNDTAYYGGEHSDTSEDIVHRLANDMALKNITILKGIFPEDTETKIQGPIALLHCDVDVYISAKDIINWALPRLSIGGAIVFDDYGFNGCEGITRLVNELQSNHDLLFLHNLNGHGIFIKTK